MKIHSPSFNAQGALTRTRGVDHRFLPLKTCQKQCNLRCWRFQRWIWTPSPTDQLYLLGFGIRLKTHVKMCIYTHIYIYMLCWICFGNQIGREEKMSDYMSEDQEQVQRRDTTGGPRTREPHLNGEGRDGKTRGKQQDKEKYHVYCG